ncbi:hypothetical protein [Streptomyces sp. NBC_00203]
MISIGTEARFPESAKEVPAGGSLRPLRDPQAAGLDDDEDGGQH